MATSFDNTNTKLTFIGAGNMASAIIGGLISKGYNPAHITASDPFEESLSALSSATGVNTTTDNIAAIRNADVIVLAIKPQVLQQVIAPLASILAAQHPLIISIAAGISMDSLENWLGNHLPIVRCMPNTPALVETGATGLLGNKNLTEQHRLLTDNIINAIGISVWVDSDVQIDAVTAVSGSGPAYFFLFMEAMQAAGVNLGLSESISTQLTLQTALGASKMAMQSDVDVAELRKRVTSPAGTTEKALAVFEDGGLRQLVEKALKAAEVRSKELAEELGGAI